MGLLYEDLTGAILQACFEVSKDTNLNMMDRMIRMWVFVQSTPLRLG